MKICVYYELIKSEHTIGKDMMKKVSKIDPERYIHITILNLHIYAKKHYINTDKALELYVSVMVYGNWNII